VTFRRTDDLRITQTRPLIPPAILLEEIPISEAASNVVSDTRVAIGNTLKGLDPRLVVVAGPCSIHDTKAALDYAQRLQQLAARYSSALIVVMRSYFEKPRTSVGWKGLINDPDLTKAFTSTRDSAGPQAAARRQRHGAADRLGVSRYADSAAHRRPTSWVAIGARTTESQVHRELASGLSMPVGFKNGTDGNTQTAVDAILSARSHTGFHRSPRKGSRRFSRPRATTRAT
jgi:3-deoxy-7-phosphoheptulonate synthase